MAKTMGYMVGTTVVASLKELGEILGKRVTKAQVTSGQVEGVSVVEIDDESGDVVDINTNEVVDNIADDDVPTSDTQDEVDEDEQDDVPPATPPVQEDLSGVEYPEKGTLKDEKALKKIVKKLSDAALEEWCVLEGLEWKANEHAGINRMRMAMAIKAYHFPPAPTKGKSKSKYSHYTTEDLVSMALENNVTVKDDKGDPRILRMYTIMALREAGIIA